MNEPIKKRKEIAIQAAQKVKNIILERKLDYVEKKEDGTPVTNLDREAEIIIRDTILKKFPGDGFLGEEGNSNAGINGYFWFVDPIDGTKSFIKGQRTVATSICLLEHEKPVLGVVLNPYTDELFIGSDERAVLYTRGKEYILPCRSVLSLKKATLNLNISTPFSQYLGLFGFMKKAGEVERVVYYAGSIAYNLCLVAEGAISAHVAIRYKPGNLWDVAPAVYIIERAGGLVTDLEGNKFEYKKSEKTIFCASNSPNIHEELLEVLNRYLPEELKNK